MAYTAAFSQSIAIMAYVGVGAEMEDCKYLSINNISTKLAIPVPSIKRIISMLKRSGLLETKTGVDGGLALSRDAAKISLFDIFNAIEGVNPLFKVYDDFDYEAFAKNADEVATWVENEKTVLNQIEVQMLAKLKATSLKSILTDHQ